MNSSPNTHIAHFYLPSAPLANKMIRCLKARKTSLGKTGADMSRYELDPILIGEGGFGKIRKGRDPALDRPVAVKTLDPLWAAADADDKERFKREAKILAKLS